MRASCDLDRKIKILQSNLVYVMDGSAPMRNTSKECGLSMAIRKYWYGRSYFPLTIPLAFRARVCLVLLLACLLSQPRVYFTVR